MKIRCAMIDWIDSFHMDNWTDGEDIGKVKPEFSCGILVKDEPEFVTIALSHAQESGEYGHLISIPRVAIRSCTIFTRSIGEKPRAKRAPVAKAAQPGT